MANSRRKVQRWQDIPLILQIDGAVQDTASIRSNRAVRLSCHFILCEVKTNGHQMITKALIELVTELPACIFCPIPLRYQMIFIGGARYTHLIFRRVINFYTPDQISISIICISVLQ